MTTKPVTNVTGIVGGFGRMGVSGAGNVSSLTESFSSVMQKTTGQGQGADAMMLQTGNSRKSTVPDNTLKKETSKVSQKMEKDIRNNTGCEKSEETLNEVKKALEKAGKEIVKEVADTLGISEEEVEAAMETLGLSAVSLLDSANLTQLMLNLSGETDMLALTMNEALYANIRNLTNTLGEQLGAVKDAFGLSDEQLEASLEELMAGQEGIQSAADMGDNPVFDVRDGKGTEDGPEKAVITLTKNGEEIKAVVETDGKTGAATITQESNPLTGQSESGGMAQEESGRRGEQDGKDMVQNPNLLLQNLQQDAAQVSQNAELPFADVQTQDIMNQIMDYMRVQIRPDTTSLEMQLHPESLGTLNIHITAKDGILTAQFTAQNETVKNVIEAQLITLQQNFNEQGLKVEAVEVNVAAQEFNRNMEQGRNQGGSPSEEAKKKNVRRLNLNVLDSLEEEALEEMEEADKIAVDMMARNGNSVDYLA